MFHFEWAHWKGEIPPFKAIENPASLVLREIHKIFL